MFPACDAEVTYAITDGVGRFRLTWNADNSRANGASVAFTATGYVPQYLPNDVFTSTAPLHERVVKLRRAPLVELTLVDYLESTKSPARALRVRTLLRRPRHGGPPGCRRGGGANGPAVVARTRA